MRGSQTKNRQAGGFLVKWEYLVMIKKNFLLYVFLSLIILVFLVIFGTGQNNSAENKVCFKDYCFNVELVKKEQTRTQGLMFRENLDSDKGMLFIFEEEEKYSFWMKNTLLALDIIWINQDKQVVFIKENAQPCLEEECQRINPDKKAKYVLEINAGIVNKINLKIGDKLIFDFIPRDCQEDDFLVK